LVNTGNFTDNIGKRLSSAKLPVLTNPFGVLYNPASVLNALKRIKAGNSYQQEELTKYQDLWLSFDHYTLFSDKDPNPCLHKINDSLKTANAFLQKTKFLFITLGTSWVYIYRKTGRLVANCHKIPAREFDREQLTVKEITDSYAPFLQELLSMQTDLLVYFTISPVRHWKDGAWQNQLSKSVLFLAIHELINTFSRVHYFPSYEIMMDDLRDYRFYTSDLLHPNEMAIEYLWEKFLQALVDPKALEIYEDIKQIIRAAQHRPVNIDSEDTKKFAQKMLEKTEEFQTKYPFLDLGKEKKHFYSLLY